MEQNIIDWWCPMCKQISVLMFDKAHSKGRCKNCRREHRISEKHRTQRWNRLKDPDSKYSLRRKQPRMKLRLRVGSRLNSCLKYYQGHGKVMTTAEYGVRLTKICEYHEKYLLNIVRPEHHHLIAANHWDFSNKELIPIFDSAENLWILSVEQHRPKGIKIWPEDFVEWQRRLDEEPSILDKDLIRALMKEAHRIYDLQQQGLPVPKITKFIY